MTTSSLLQETFFYNYLYDLGLMKKIILEEFFHKVQKLESFKILEVPTQVVSEVAGLVAAAVKMGIKVEWIDRVIGEIGIKKDNYALLHEVRMLGK